MSAADTEREICYIRDQLDNYIKQDADDASVPLQYLNKLRRLPITLELLQKTRIGMTVNQYRKATRHDSISNQAKELIKGWKKFVPDASAPPPASSTTSSSTSKKEKRDRTQAEHSEDSNHGSIASSAPSNGDKKKHKKGEKHKASFDDDGESGGERETEAKRSKANSSVRESSSTAGDYSSGSVGKYEDPARLKCREMIMRALLITDGPAPSVGRELVANECAKEVEEAVFADCGGSTSQRYRMRIISRVQNLKDSKNPQLREAVLSGAIAPEKFASMTSEEMASPELKQLRQQYQAQALDQSRMAFTGGTKSTLLKCKRCNKQSVTYNQMQTRSSDEPMTTFCFCNECGFRWKFC